MLKGTHGSQFRMFFSNVSAYDLGAFDTVQKHMNFVPSWQAYYLYHQGQTSADALTILGACDISDLWTS